jgi:hypothetical protein
LPDNAPKLVASGTLATLLVCVTFAPLEGNEAERIRDSAKSELRHPDSNGETVPERTIPLAHNFLERFAEHSDPSDDQSQPRPLALGSSTPTTTQFQFRVRKDAPSNAYALSWSGDYQSWTSLSPAEVTTIAVTPDGRTHHLLTIEIPAPGSHCFLRLGVD